MLIPRPAISIFCVSMMLLGSVACGQNYPNKPIHILTSGVGAGPDLAARLIAQTISGSLGQQVIVENKDVLIAIETVAKAPADGYTLLAVGNTLWYLPLMQSVRFDSLRDFASISLANRAPSILVVHPSLPVNSTKDLIALAKMRPGELNYAAASTGSSPHLSAELFKAMAGINIVRIAYKSAVAGLNDLIGGEVQVTFIVPGAAIPHIKSGRLRALAVTSAEPSMIVPGLPTVAASGVPGYESVSMTGIFAPAKTLATLINRLNHEVVRVLNQAEIREKFFNVGLEAVGGSPEEMTAAMKSDMLRMGKVIKDAGIRAD